jgi:hypothetical protein
MQRRRGFNGGEFEAKFADRGFVSSRALRLVTRSAQISSQLLQPEHRIAGDKDELSLSRRVSRRRAPRFGSNGFCGCSKGKKGS